MRVPGPDDPELTAAVRRIVVKTTRPGRYLELLHGNVLNLRGADRAGFMHTLGNDARHTKDEELGMLLDSEWRSRLTAAWLIGLDRRTHFRNRLGEALLDSQHVYAGQGYCLALARFETAADANLLCAYLDRYLPRADCYYDQDWAIGALMHLDDRLSANRAARFLRPGGPWQHSAMNKRDPAEQHRMVARLCTFASECMRDTTDDRDTPGDQA